MSESADPLMDHLAAALGDLKRRLPDATVVTAPATREAHRYDHSMDPTAETPAAVVRARSTRDVCETLRWAHAHRVPVVPRGAGTSLAGGASGIAHGIVLSLEEMRDIKIDEDARVAVALAGALNVDVKRAAGRVGLAYPPDPSSFEISTIGGNIATNAGGLCCVKYGVTGTYVLGLEVVLADGTLVQLGGPLLKDVAGLDLLSLVVGSEGTLGVVTAATLRLVSPSPPPATMVATFASPADAGHAVTSILGTLQPSMAELMDRTAIVAVEDWRSVGLDRSAGAVLLLQTDSALSARGEELQAMERACVAAGATACFATEDAEEAELFVAARRIALLAIERRGSVLLEDVGVPLPRLPDLLAGIEDVARSHGLEIPVIAHAGDGNTHPVIVHDAADPASLANARAAFDELMSLAIGLGGTITGEHGVGRAKRSALPVQLGEDVVELNRRVKLAFDPLGILNPGVLL